MKRQDEDEEEFLTPAEVAAKLKVSTQTVLNKYHSGEWEGTEISERIYRFTQEQYEAIAAGRNRRQRPSRKRKLHEALKAIS